MKTVMLSTLAAMMIVAASCTNVHYVCPCNGRRINVPLIRDSRNVNRMYVVRYVLGDSPFANERTVIIDRSLIEDNGLLNICDAQKKLQGIIGTSMSLSITTIEDFDEIDSIPADAYF